LALFETNSALLDKACWALLLLGDACYYSLLTASLWELVTSQAFKSLLPIFQM